MTATTALGYTLDELDRRGAQRTALEISRQPALWREVGSATASRREESDAFLRPLLAQDDLRIILTGAGSSAFAGQVLAPALTRELRRRVDAVPTTDVVSSPWECFAEDRPTLLVSVARSGDSPESVATTELADQCLSEVHHLIVTCNADGQLYGRYSRDGRSLVLLMPEPANDQGFAMTSSFTCMMLATRLVLGKSTPDDGLVERLAAAAEQVLSERAPAARALAQRTYERVVYLGSGSLMGLARESALKLLELTAGGIVAYFDSALGFRHGPKSLLDNRTLAVIYLSNDPYTRSYDEDIANELRRALGPDSVVVVTGRPIDRVDDGQTWRVEGLHDVDDAGLALPFAVCAQLLSLQFSLTLGKTPDNPFPAGEVNRVVQGVTIHALHD